MIARLRPGLSAEATVDVRGEGAPMPQRRPADVQRVSQR